MKTQYNKFSKLGIFLLLFCIFTGSQQESAAELQRSQGTYQNYGLFGNYGSLIYNASFSKLPGVPNCCPEFSNGSGSSYSFGGLFDFNFNDVGFSLRAGFSSNNGNFTSVEKVLLGINGQPVEGEFTHKLDISFSSVGLTALFNYKFIDKLNVAAGFNTNLNVSSTFNQSETITKPAGKATFLDSAGNNTNKFVRNERSGSIPDINFILFTGVFKLGFELPLSTDGSLKLVPEASLEYTLNNIINNLSIKNLAIKFGVSVLISNAKYINIKSKESGELSLAKQIELLKFKNDSLISANQKHISDKSELQDQIFREQQEKNRLFNDLTKKEKLLKDADLKNALEQEKLEQEKQNINENIDNENKIVGKKCTCFVMLFYSSTEKKDANKVLNSLKNNGIEGVNISAFIEPILKQKYFRVKSGCFARAEDATSEMVKINNILQKLNLSTQIICDK